ncbi:MAG: RIP metalloprotease RseP [Anaerolineae bacterium]|nr:RIP metalloprotease RseP [Anaerolineae bacterium]
MNDLLLTIISFLVVLGPLVLIHEFGHFIAARMIGVTVLEFGLGFPPRALTLFESKGTKFTLNWLPIGGFVRPLGEDFVKPVGPEATEKDRAAFEAYQQELDELGQKAGKTKSLMEAGPWQRIWFMSAGAIFNFAAAFLILTASSMIGQPGPAVVVLTTIPGSPAADAGLKLQDIITAVNGTPVRTVDELNAAIPAPVDGVASEITLTIQREDQTFDVKVPPTTRMLAGRAVGVWVQETAEGSPAALVLQLGDVILKADDQTATNTDNFKAYIDSMAGKEVTLTVLRDGEEQQIKITPRENPPDGEGKLGVVIATLEYNTTYGYSISDATGGPIVNLPLGEAISNGANSTVNLMRQIAYAPIAIIRGEVKGEEGRMISPIGIAQVSKQVIQGSSGDSTPYRILNFIAVISIALGVTNLLPFPGLDGGRILFVIFELIRGKPVNPEREGMVHLIGIMLLLALVAVLAVNDILHPIGPIIAP